MGIKNENVCCSAPTLIFACSGAADVGAIADKAARRLTADGASKMYCLAGIGGRVPGIIKTTQEAEKILAIDGCPLDCTKLSLEEAREISGVRNVHWLEKFESMLRELILSSENIYGLSHELAKFRPEYPSRDERYMAKLKKEFPLHSI